MCRGTSRCAWLQAKARPLNPEASLSQSFNTWNVILLPQKPGTPASVIPKAAQCDKSLFNCVKRDDTGLDPDPVIIVRGITHMKAITLHYPVQTIDRNEILSAETVLSPRTMESLISPERKTPLQAMSLLQYGTVRDDLLKFLSQPPNNAIYDGQERVAEVMDLMNGIKLILPVLQSLQYFRENDFGTYRHILLVSSLATLLLKDLVPNHAERIRETATGPTHDFGKICIPLSILKKSSPLTRTERGILEHHAAAGFVLLVHYLQDPNHIAARVARDHHERKDGSGYPRGIRLDTELVEIVAVSDVYDALISPRPYRPKAFDNRTAIEEITRMAERNEIGWEPVKALVARNRRSKPDHRECSVALTKRGTPPEGNLYGLIAEDDEVEKDS